MTARIGNGVNLSTGGIKWKLNTVLFADNAVLIAENERDVQKLVNTYNIICHW